VFSQSSVNRIGLGNLDRLHKGYADGGSVDMPVMRAPAAPGGSGGGMEININNTITAPGATAETLAGIQQALRASEARTKASIIPIVQAARSRGAL
jgi:hypothetical protein